MDMRSGLWLAALLFLVGTTHAGDETKFVRHFQIEVLYTMHTRVDTDAKLERIRALVLRAYPKARIAEVSPEERRTYYAVHCDRLLRMAGASPPAGDDDARREWFMTRGFELAKAQVDREVALLSIYKFLHALAKDDHSLKVIFDQLRKKDDPKHPLCGTEAGATAIVYRDFGGARLTAKELAETEDSGVKFGRGFAALAFGVGHIHLPRMFPKVRPLGDDGEGRQIFRVVAVTDVPSAPPPHNADGG